MKLRRYSRWVRYWLVAGCILLFFQVFIGGVTRITGSGLSITKWEIVTGVFPPSDTRGWKKEFDLYKQTPQYEKINDGMTMSDFKFIYFWEYFHRLWARMMGFIFLFPFLFFLFTKRIDSRILKMLGLVIVGAISAASMGWIMVASGLINRPWVNAYKLALHLSTAFLTYGFLIWVTFISFKPSFKQNEGFRKLKVLVFSFTALFFLQLFLGGVMSGMRAGLVYPTWPDMHGEFIPRILLDNQMWNVDNFNNYERSAFLPALIHVLHRFTAYILGIMGMILFIKLLKSAVSKLEKVASYLLISLLIAQVIIGIITVVNCKGSIPLFYGVLHQGVALLLLSSVLFVNYLVFKGEVRR